MDAKYEKLKSKFYDGSERLYKIPFGERILTFNENVLELAKIRNYFRKANNDMSKWFSDIRGVMVFLEATEYFVKDFTKNLADAAVNLVIEYDIYDVSANDFLESRGRTEKHKSIYQQYNEVMDWRKTVGKYSDADSFMVKIQEGLVILKEMVSNIEQDVIDILRIPYIPYENRMKAYSILENIQKGIIPRSKINTALIQAIQLFPVYSDLYKEGRKIFGNTNNQFNELEQIMLMDKSLYDIDFIKLDYSSFKNEENIEEKKTARSTQKVEKKVDDSSRSDEMWTNAADLAAEHFNIAAVYHVKNWDKDEKTRRKFESAIGSYAKACINSKTEKVLACYDTTLWGACDEGCVFTTKGIYIHDDNYGTVYLKYEDINEDSIRIKEGLVDNICINDVELDTSQLGGDAGKARFVEMVKFFVLASRKV